MSTTTAAPHAADADRPWDGRPQPFLGGYPYQALKALASLRLTVALFVLSLGLVFFGTLAQMNSGVWTVVGQYFWSNWVKVDVQLLVQFARIFDPFGIVSPTATVSGWFPYIGGKLLGFLLLVNLLAAHLVRFKLSWNRAGVIALHAGIVLLFVGEYITREYSVEQRMEIAEGQTAAYAYDIRNCELAFVDGSDPVDNQVVVAPGHWLEAGGRIADPELPVDVQVVEYYKNAFLDDPKPGEPNRVTAGYGLKARVMSREEVSGVDTDQSADFPAAVVTLYKKGTDAVLGTFLVSTYGERLGLRQSVDVDGKSYDLALRFTRHYKPYSVKLLEFRFDRFVGTQTAKNYSSRVVLTDPERGVNEEVLISMNDPLRYRGETFYQAGFDPKTEKATTLQVVRNPGWLLPYWACGIVGVGMLVHFGRGLTAFLNRRSASLGRAAVQPHTGLERGLPWVAAGLTVAVLAAVAVLPFVSGGAMDLAAAGRLPVVDGGRLKPLDSVARVNLRVISTREDFIDGADRRQPAIKWLLDTASAPTAAARNDLGPAAKYHVFRIESDQVRKLLDLPRREGMRYSFEELGKKGREFDEAVRKSADRPKKDRDLFDAKVLDLRRQVTAYMEVMTRRAPLVLPPAGGADWRSAGDAEEAITREMFTALRAKFPNMTDPHALSKEQLAEAQELAIAVRTAAEAKDPAYVLWDKLLAAYRKPDAAEFNKLVAEYRQTQYPNLSKWDAGRVYLEWFLNGFAPFYYCIGLYVFAFLLAVGGWVGAVARPTTGESLRRAALGVLVVTFAVHLTALLARMYLMDRPLVFVTNLYSSAIFIGAASVAMCLLIERLFPIGLGNAVASGLGAGTCIIAHNLAAGGDTLEMMQAVLDTNFWLATHVTTITLGYSATYVAGAIAIAYVLLGVTTPVLDRPVPFGTKTVPLGRLVGMVTYGVICGATLLSFVGTVLGGIWADQSWGRFWGWDPKENGAVLIVIWNALILHARWAGLVKDRGVAVLALVGNMITTWSWFGTNQLGAGLHNYGFNNTLAVGCAVTWLVHVGLLMVGLSPTRYWASHPNRVSA